MVRGKFVLGNSSNHFQVSRLVNLKFIGVEEKKVTIMERDTQRV